MSVRSIHPDPGGPTHAESPYTRKLKRLMEDMRLTASMAPAEHAGLWILVLAQMEEFNV